MQNSILLSGSTTKDIAKEIRKQIKIPLQEIEVQSFSDQETFVKIPNSIRGKDIFYIQSTSFPANDNIMELLLTLDAIKRSSAKSVTLIVPYFGYSRQERKTEARTPISTKLVADLIQSAGINRLITLDIHADQIQGFFNIPVDNLYGANIFIEYLKQTDLSNTVIASPDAGGVSRARYFAKKLGINDLAIIDKRREKANQSEVMNVLGNVKGKQIIIIDDMIDTGGTLIKGAKAFIQNGATSVKACITHGVLSGNAFSNLKNGQDYLNELILTDSITPKEHVLKNMTYLKTAPLIAEVIERLRTGNSISELWD